MAERSIHPSSQDEKAREELAFLEGHNADFPTNTGVDFPSKESSQCTSTSPTDVEKGSAVKAGTAQTATATQPTTEVREEPSANRNIVFWDGPDDPANPMNWSAKIKWSHIAIISCITFVTFVPR